MRKLLLFAASALLLQSCATKPEQEMTKFTYPETRKADQVDNYFGQQIADPYRWLEDDNSDETKAWVKAQNKVTFDYLHAIPFRQNIIDRLTTIWNYEKFSTPFKRAGKYFFYKNDGLQNQSVLFMQNSLEAEAEVLLDPNKLSEDGTVALSGMAISKDGKYLAYSIARGGSDWNEIYVRNIETKEELTDHVLWVKFSGISWYQDGFYYSRYDEPKEGEALTASNVNQKVFYHKIGTEQADDKLIYKDDAHPKRGFGAGVTEDEKYLVLSEWESTSGNGLLIKDLANEKSDFIRVVEGFDSEYNVVDHQNGELFILTNFAAPKYRLVKANIAEIVKHNKESEGKNLKYDPRENWSNVLPETEDVLTSVQLGADKFVAEYMKDAHSLVKIYNYDGSFTADLDLPTLGSLGGFSSKKGETEAFYSFTSFTIPSVAYKYDFTTNKSEEYRKPALDIDLNQFETKQVFYTSKDGTKVPMFIVHKKGVKLDGNNPTLLYAYGGFNISLTPSFSITRMLWLENGGVYAMANLRGGGEYGEEWHKAGTKLQKQNVFDDFIAAAEYLIAEKYTSSDKLAIQGGSNGGLLIGAVTNQRPELFKVALPAVGVMDMLRYQYFTIGRAWSSDYGLSENEEEFNALVKYSPVHTVKENTEYPAVLVTTADHDDRVVPAHSFKYISTLQDKYKGSNPVMIRIETKAGHGAGKPTSKRIEEAADLFAFTYKNMGINPYEAK